PAPLVIGETTCATVESTGAVTWPIPCEATLLRMAVVPSTPRRTRATVEVACVPTGVPRPPLMCVGVWGTGAAALRRLYPVLFSTGAAASRRGAAALSPGAAVLSTVAAVLRTGAAVLRRGAAVLRTGGPTLPTLFPAVSRTGAAVTLTVFAAVSSV